MQETYLERIKQLKSAQKITNDRLSELTGIPLGTLSKLLAGISDSPKLANIVAISQALGCSLDWLITGVPENTNNYTLSDEEVALIEDYRLLDAYGRDLTAAVISKERDRAAQQKAAELLALHDAARGRTIRARRKPQNGSGNALSDAAENAHRYKSMPASPALPEVESEPAAGASRTARELKLTAAGVKLTPVDRRQGELPLGLRRRQIPMYDMPVSAGIGEFLSDSTRTQITIPDMPRTQEADYALCISGDSMEPRYHSGDVLLVQTAESVEEGELGIFVLDGSGYFKKYGGDCLISLNPRYAPIPLKDFESVNCCGRVVGKLRKK